MQIDARFVRDTGREVFSGNELLVKGILETGGGVHFLTGCANPPIAGVFDALGSVGALLREKGVVVEPAETESLSIAMLHGAQGAGCRAVAVVEAGGLQTACDPLSIVVRQGTSEASGGLVVCGDDVDRVQADPRVFSQQMGMPMVEPSSGQEIKDWVDLAFKLGAVGRTCVGYCITAEAVTGGGTVVCRPNQFPGVNEHQKRLLRGVCDLGPGVNRSRGMSSQPGVFATTLAWRLEAVAAGARRLGINRILHQPHKGETAPLGFIASGVAYAYLCQALAELGLTGRLPILKLGLSFPVDEQIVAGFAGQCRKVIVIEQRSGFVEDQVTHILHRLAQAGGLETQVYGKRFPAALRGIPDAGGLTPSILIERLVPLLQGHAGLGSGPTHTRFEESLGFDPQAVSYGGGVPSRTPTFCAGCPQRDASSALLWLRNNLHDPQYMLAHHKRKPVDLIVHGDGGCNSMLAGGPEEPAMYGYSGHGLGGASAGGAGRLIENKQVVFLGDGSLLHHGMAAIQHSVRARQDVAYIIVANKAAVPRPDAVGEQGHPRAGMEDIEREIRGVIPKALAKGVSITRIDPGDHRRYRTLLEQSILAEGVKIVITDKECGAAHHYKEELREKRVIEERGYPPKKTHVNITQEVCEHCLECTSLTGCPGLKVIDTDYGPKVQTDLTSCVGDEVCHKVSACPAFERVTVVRKRPPRAEGRHTDTVRLPAAARPIHAGQGVWRCHIAGIGGMGVGIATRVLTAAGHEMGYRVEFLNRDHAGFRYGGVAGQLVYSRMASPGDGSSLKLENSVSAFVPHGEADLILGVDLLEAIRGVDAGHRYRVASPARTAAVVNTSRTSTGPMGKEELATGDLEAGLRRYTHPRRCLAFEVGQISERLLGSKLYVNTIMLGMAYQKGFLPLKVGDIEKAIHTILPGDSDRNLRAFHLGRRVAARPERFGADERDAHEPSHRTVRRKSRMLRVRYGGGKRSRHLVKQFHVLMKQVFHATKGAVVDDGLLRDVVIRAYDCLIWGGIEYAREYCRRVIEVFQKDSADRGYAVTRAVVWNLAKVMLIKDGVYVAALQTNPEKYRRDRKRFGVVPSRGDRLEYRFMLRPGLNVLGSYVGFEWNSRPWQMRVVSRMKFLRDLWPGWHKRERDFRDWYGGVVDHFDWEPSKGAGDYQRWLAVLGVPQAVVGYRELRYPKIEAARRRGEALLRADPDRFESPQSEGVSPDQGSGRSIQLPVLTEARG